MSLSEVSAVGSVPKCQGTQHRACQAGTVRDIQCRERWQPKVLVRNLCVQPYSCLTLVPSHFPSIRKIDPGCVGEIHAVAGVSPVLPTCACGQQWTLDMLHMAPRSLGPKNPWVS